ncbi:MAG: DNA gyrase subunit A [bacterium]|jgi:DNA gyrase subunit A
MTLPYQESESSVNIEDKMRSAYLEYAMSVIVGRALPDVRDGLKPVHRRVLYAMHDLNVAHNRPYMKSARIVGEVIGKYHPHGDSAVYDATVRLAQPFSMRCPLVNGQGNFGSIDGDSPAAMRYTEVRLQKITQEFLADLEKDTVDFVENYDGSLEEPTVLPTKIPNLLVNGSTGIAVGMATNIPPHNLTEIVSALLYVIDANKEATVDGIMEYVQGPDFPTGGIILGTTGIESAYKTGKGIIPVRAKVHFEDIKNSQNREAIIVTELPYMVNKARLVEKIADLVRDKKIEGIQDLRDESDRKGMRVVIELKRGEQTEAVAANLYKHTSLQTSVGITLLAIVDNQPRVLTILEILKFFIKHRVEVIIRRTRFDLKKAEARAHILEGLEIALGNIDDVVKVIRASKGGKEAKENLIQQYSLSPEQSQAILDMRLQRLTALERDKLIDELEGLQANIKQYKEILSQEKLVLEIIKTELLEVREQYGEARRTEMSNAPSSINTEDLIPVEEMVVTLSQEGYIKRSPLETYQAQRRGGKGKIGMTTKDEDVVSQMFVASSHDTLLIFTNLGKVYWKKVYELPSAHRIGKGRAIINILPLDENEHILSCLPITEYDEESFVVMITKKGIIKKSALTVYKNARSNGTKAIIFDDDDHLVGVRLCKSEDLIFIATKNGMATKFPSEKLRTQGRVTRGCKGISLKVDDNDVSDTVISMEVVSGEGTLLTVTEKGIGKKTEVDQYRLGSRGNVGVLNLRKSEKTGSVVGTVLVSDDDELIIITKSGKLIRLETSQIRTSGRVTQGVKLIDLKSKDSVVSIAKLVKSDNNDEQETEEDNKTVDESEVPEANTLE